MIKPAPEVTCCDLIENEYVDDSETHLCRQCKEHTCSIKCRVCDETLSESECCG
jgi:hypothetical protein